MKLALLVIVVMGMLDAALGVCPTPESIEYGYYDAPGGYSEGSIITYHCNDGYLLFTTNGGSLNNTCTSGAWEDTPPFCGEDCNNPQNITHGTKYVQYYDGAVYYVEYTCDDDYWLLDPGDSNNRGCYDGYLHGNLPTCYKVVGCLPPPGMDSFANGTITHNIKTPGSGLRYDTLEYLCDDGYTLRATHSPVRICKYPDWLGPDPYCELAGYCKKPVDPQNGHASYSDHDAESTVTYSCDDGYELHGGDAFQMCNYFETWTNETGDEAYVPTCVKPDSDFGSDSDSGHVVPWRNPAWRDDKYKGNAQLREKRRGWCKSYLNRHYKGHFWHPYQH